MTTNAQARAAGEPASGSWRAILVVVGFLLVIVGLIALGMSGIGYRSGMWDLRAGLTIFKWAGMAVWGGVVLSLIALFAGRTRPVLAIVSVIVGLVAGITYAGWIRAAKRAPPIHDISTDVGSPPAFVAILPLRAGAPNPPEYGGPTIAAQQQAGYPDLGPLTVSSDPAHTFHTARHLVERSGWDLVAADSAAGRIEATATTPWFGFKDDVVIRIVAAAPAGSRVDMRSVSRVGGSDVGTNAVRIRHFLRELKTAE
jgi:uncharacterized protein (DUF1499 family)